MNKSKRQNSQPTTMSIVKNSSGAPDKLLFAAVQGRQGKYVTWTIQMPFQVLADLFEADSEGSAIVRSQREVNKNRAKKVTHYIRDNSHDYVLPSLTATIEDDKLTTALEKIGEKRGYFFNPDDFETTTKSINLDNTAFGSMVILEVPVTSRWWFVDGQHRATGITGLKAMLSVSGVNISDVYPSDTICLMCRRDTGLEDRQAQFSAINSNMVKPNGSLNALYVRKNNGASILISSAIRTTFKSQLVEFEKTTCSGSSPRLFAYKSLIDASLSIFNTKLDAEMLESDGEYLSDFWTTYLSLDGLHLGFNRTASEVRVESTLPHSVMIAAMALVGRHFHQQGIKLSSLKRALNKIDFNRDSAQWVGKCLTEERALVKKANNIRTTADHIISQIEASSIYKQVVKKAAIEAQKDEPAKKVIAA